ncbi:MAG TPA: hypothetical protein PK997_00765 [Candidatus Omnitrophota bacterium]|nr:hypothetical protein [Candidatus Omnitrophota bacterium]
MIAWIWVIAGAGFLFAVRGRHAFLPRESVSPELSGVWREMLDLFLTVALSLTIFNALLLWDRTAVAVRGADFLVLWCFAFLAGRYQKKDGVFHLTAAVIALAVLEAKDLALQLSLAGAVVGGLFLFLTAFAGLRYAVRFSKIPETVRGWPLLCLLAFCIMTILGGILSYIF